MKVVNTKKGKHLVLKNGKVGYLIESKIFKEFSGKKFFDEITLKKDKVELRLSKKKIIIPLHEFMFIKENYCLNLTIDEETKVTHSSDFTLEKRGAWSAYYKNPDGYYVILNTQSRRFRRNSKNGKIFVKENGEFIAA